MVFCDDCNCYKDVIRYRALVIFYVIDICFFIVRLSLVSNDLSYRVPDTIPFLVPILIFDLIGSVPLIICNILYLIIRHCVYPFTHDPNANPGMWHCATMTCIRLDCHHERPQAILLTRIIFIVSFFFLRFISFVIGASCSARFKSECTAYTIIAALALAASVVVIIVEFIHFSRLWSYNPTQTINKDRSRVGIADNAPLIKQTNRRLLRFIHFSVLNDSTAEGFRRSKCKKGAHCNSYSLHHHLFYHSLDSERDTGNELVDGEYNKPFVAFYRTTKTDAYTIAQKGFPFAAKTGTHKDFFHLDSKIVFTPSCSENLRTPEAIICASLNLGRVKIVERENERNLDKYFALGDGTCDTVYVKSTKHLYLRMPAQIERWIITIASNVQVNDHLDGQNYIGCV